MKSILVTSILLLLSMMSFAQSSKVSESKYGVLFMAGARYDDVRRCVATSPGTKGGPMADIMLTRIFQLSETKSLRVNLPVMRPILFAVAFKMLQFEPEANLFFTSTTAENKKLFLSPGLGLSLNYGPDYMSDNGEDAERFFSYGPTLSFQAGLKLGAAKSSSVSARVFYTPLFASGVGTNGTVLGASIQYWFSLGK
jgi:hypothetical protein